MKNFTLSFVFLFFIVFSFAQNIAYVTPAGSGSLNGSSWTDAYPADSIQAAIDNMSALGGGQVWVAAGTYYPTVPYDGDYSNPRKKSIKIKNAVEIYGGFAGIETAVNERMDFGENGTNETILSGDIGVQGDNTDNCYHVVFDTIGMSNAILDGFTIQYGYADGSHPDNNGGGIWTRGALAIQNCVIRNNYAASYGGGVFMDENNIVKQSIIHTNTAVERGGGIYLLDYSLSGDTEPIVENSLIYNNNTTDNSGQGGGVYIRGGNGRVINCRIIANQSRRGGGVYHWQGGESINCIVAHNFANFGGGGIYIERGGVSVGNTVVSNRSNNTAWGWGIYRNYENSGYTSVARNCILWNNGNDDKQFYAVGTGTSIEYCATQGGFSEIGAGSSIMNLSSDNTGTDALNYPEFLNPHTTQGYNASLISEFLNADWRLNCRSACIDSASATLIPADITFDFDGNNRIVDGSGDGNALPDLGAFEYFAVYYQSATICQGDTLIFANTPLTISGVYYDTLTNSHNCDSIMSLTLNVLPNDTGFVQAYICQGDTFIYALQHYTLSGVYYQTAPNPTGCDSIIEITLVVFPSDTLVLADTGIYENQVFNFFGQMISIAGVYYHSLLSVNDCDSVIQQGVYIIPVDTILYDTICQGDIFVFEGTSLDTGGTYFAVIQSSSLTDSVIQLNLAEMPLDTTILDVVYLNQGSTYNFHGTVITSIGTYYHTFTSVWGCDSVLELKVSPRRYVTQNGAGNQNGHDWANAYAAEDLKMAMFNVSVAGGGQVWVAKGIYKPTTGTDRSISFIVYNNVELYGGFSGNESSINSRELYGLNQINETRLSGDINTPSDTTDNSYNIVKQQMEGYILIDGFTIRDACNPFFSGEGGGVYLRKGGVLRNCIIINNHTGYKGGGVYNAGGSITNCVITHNRSGSYGGGVCMHGGTLTNSTISHNITGNGGGGIHCQFAEVLIENCQITNNRIDGYGWGGGLNVETSHTVTVKNNTFSGNQAVIGGALSNTGTSGLLIVDSCIFHANSAVDYYAQATGSTYDGVGGALSLSKGHITNATFTNNTATKGGGARLHNSVLIENSEFFNNAAVEEGGGAYFYESGEIRSCTFTNNSAKKGGGAFLENGGIISDCLFNANTVSNMGGGAYLNTAGTITQSEFVNNFAHYGGAAYITGNALLRNSSIHHNRAHYNGGGIYNVSNNVSVLNCHVFNNYARYDGGGLYSNNENAQVLNTNFFNNEAGDEGGGAYLYFGGKLLNCNLSRNKAVNNGGGVYIEYKGHIKNSVIWGNSSQIHVPSLGFNIEIDTTAVQGGYSGNGAGSMVWDVDTMNTGPAPVHYVNFIQPTNFAGNATNPSDSLMLFTSDWGLNCGSALIDAGRNEILPDTLTKDLAGNNRFFDGNNDGTATVDLGPLEANFTYFYEVHLCEGDTFVLGSQYLTQTGFYADTLTTAGGCDSIVSIHIFMLPAYQITLTDDVCEGDSYTFPDGYTVHHITAPLTHHSHLNSINGCDSIVSITLIIYHAFTSTAYDTICDGIIYSWQGQTLTSSGTYYDSLLTIHGCDSVLILHLFVNPTYEFVETETICSADTLFWRGQICTIAGIYYDSLLTQHNCDSVFVLNLFVRPLPVVTITGLLSEYCLINQNYTMHGTPIGGSFSGAGVTYSIFNPMAAGPGNWPILYCYTDIYDCSKCDTVFVTVLDELTAGTIAASQTICYNTSPDAFTNVQLPTGGSGQYTYQWEQRILCSDVWTNISGATESTYDYTGNIIQTTCFRRRVVSDTCGTAYSNVISVDLLPVFTITQNEQICIGDTFIWRGNNYTTQGTYYDSLQTGNGCDSVYVLNLTVNNTYEYAQSGIICQGDIFSWRGHDYTLQGTYYDSLQSVHGCDSVYVLNLTVNNTYEYAQSGVICQGDIFSWRGHDYTLHGTYFDSLSTVYGCDSVYVLNLTVNPVYQFTQSEAICQGESFNWRGHVYTNQGIYYDSLTSIHNCDSVYMLHLTVNPVFEFSLTDSICFGEVFNWRGHSYNATGTYYDSLLTVNGCDSVFILDLTVNTFYFIMETENICTGDTILWRGQEYWTGGIYFDSLVAVTGCDSVYSLNLSEFNVFSHVTYDTICQGGSYFWQDDTYTASGTYYNSFTSQFSCDSTYVLYLTVSPIHNIVHYDTICNGNVYNWQGNNYTTGGFYYAHLQTSHGCDSVLTLTLYAHSLPVVNINLPDTFFCDYHAPVSISGTPAGGTFSGQGVSANIFDPAMAGTGTWQITYTYPDSNACENSATITVLVDACVGLLESGDDNIKLYPNPNDGNFIIELFEETHISIFNTFGVEVFNRLLIGGTHPIQLNHLPDGVYYIKAEGIKTSGVLRIVVQR